LCRNPWAVGVEGGEEEVEEAREEEEAKLWARFSSTMVGTCDCEGGYAGHAGCRTAREERGDGEVTCLLGEERRSDGGRLVGCLECQDSGGSLVCVGLCVGRGTGEF